MSMTERIQVAMKEIPASLILRNVRILHLTTGEVEESDIVLDDEGMIAAVGRGYEGKRVIDGRGAYAVPGFIDAHFHLESTLTTPRLYQQNVTAHGVTTAVCDPHELANVVGEAAFDFYLKSAEAMRMSLIVRLSSCVPATGLETSGVVIDAAALARWRAAHPELGLGEFMNVPGVVWRDPAVIQKLLPGGFVDGHCPGASGETLNAYCSTGIRNDHECSTVAEAQEKLRRGMQIFIREGSAARNLDALMPLLTLENSMQLALCTDDQSPLDRQERGHIDSMIRRAIAAGVSPLVAYRVASFSAARGLELWDRGLIAPGRRGDIVLLSNLEECRIQQVFVKGLPQEELWDSEDPARYPSPEPFRNTVKCRAVIAADFPMPPQDDVKRLVMGVRDGDLVTDRLELSTRESDVLPLAVVERHGHNGNIGHGLVHGFCLKGGAIASTVGHDSHNICVVGTSSQAMADAVNALRESQGGFVVVSPDGTKTLLPLPLGGLFTDVPTDALVENLRVLHKAALDLGCPLRDPFLQLAFLPLPVIPHLKLTDRGLVDVDAFQLLPPVY
jgi:adenine deaminase